LYCSGEHQGLVKSGEGNLLPKAERKVRQVTGEQRKGKGRRGSLEGRKGFFRCINETTSLDIEKQTKKKGREIAGKKGGISPKKLQRGDRTLLIKLKKGS